MTHVIGREVGGHTVPCFPELWLSKHLNANLSCASFLCPNVLGTVCCPSPPVLGSLLGVLPDLINSPSRAPSQLLLLTSLMRLSHCSVALIAVTVASTRQ